MSTGKPTPARFSAMGSSRGGDFGFSLSPNAFLSPTEYCFQQFFPLFPCLLQFSLCIAFEAYAPPRGGPTNNVTQLGKRGCALPECSFAVDPATAPPEAFGRYSSVYYNRP